MEIDNIDGLLDVLERSRLGIIESMPIAGGSPEELREQRRISSLPNTIKDISDEVPFTGYCHCSKCGCQQRHELNPTNWTEEWNRHQPDKFEKYRINPPPPKRPDNYYDAWYENHLKTRCPLLLKYICLNCRSETVVVLYIHKNELTMIMLPQGYGGISTPNTNPNVAYYLDQAFRCKTSGAYSATVAMYRAALEMILHHEGYDKGNLGGKKGKIKQLEKDIQDGNGPVWAKEIEPDVLELLKSIGDGAIHSNDGDVQKQQVIDDELLLNLESIIIRLLLEIYEIPAQRRRTKSELEAAKDILKR